MNHEQRLPYLNAFIFQLADLTYRSEDEILSTGLHFDDFVNNVLIKFEDGSTLNFNHAFFVESDDSVGVFTEHCGYYAFHKTGIDYMKQVPRSVSIKPVKEDKPEKESKNKPKKVKKTDVNLIPVDTEKSVKGKKSGSKLLNSINKDLRKIKKLKRKVPLVESHAFTPIKPVKEKNKKPVTKSK